ncbi:MAG: hypothetical protein V3U24_07090 [Candidatus Neomarinimicrobiota bacterium]
MKRLAFIFLIIVAQTQNISAREVFNQLQPGARNVYFNFEMDPVFAIVAGYARNIEIKKLSRNVTLTGDITLPIFVMDLKHYRIDLGSRTALFNSEKWNIISALSVINKGTDNPVYAGYLFSIEEGLLLGHFATEWYMAIDLSYEKFLFTKIEHTHWYKESVHTDAKDGWYSSTGGNITFGLQGGYTFRNVIELTLRFGMYKTEGFNNAGGIPFVVNIGMNYHLQRKIQKSPD